MSYNIVEEVRDYGQRITKTPKTYWDHWDKTWKNTVIWTMPHTPPAERWLKEHYYALKNDRNLGWYTVLGKITMNEKIYLHYCLAKPE